jgi:hypothetical protein
MSSLLLDENAVADRIKDGLLIRHMPEVRKEGRKRGEGGRGRSALHSERGVYVYHDGEGERRRDV